MASSSSGGLAHAVRPALSRRLLAGLLCVGLVLAALVRPPTASAVTGDTLNSWSGQVFQVMNQERAANGLYPYAHPSQLYSSASLHNFYMALYNVMAHQLPDEPDLGTREVMRGYDWQAAGENVGWTTDISLNGVLNLQQMMYNETPPNDGHRRNILSTTYRDAGVNIWWDAAHGKLWMTEDFGLAAPPAAPAATAAGVDGYTLNSWSGQVFQLMNQERAANGLYPYAHPPQLYSSASLHNFYMALYNVMAHQLPLEPDLGTREVIRGYSWQAAGENVGWTTDISLNGVLNLERMMYNETPPEDGHRRNILSTTYRDAGVNIWWDAAHGKLWLSEDFGLHS